MKNISLFLLACVLISSCGVNENIPNENNIVSEFKLSDLNGNEKNVFIYGEGIKMSFTVRNKSEKELIYQYTGSSTTFKILRNDSIVATSQDGDIQPVDVVKDAKVAPGESLNEEWLTPDTVRRNIKIILPVGIYKAVVQHNVLFSNYKLEATEPIEFSVIK